MRDYENLVLLFGAIAYVATFWAGLVELSAADVAETETAKVAPSRE